MDKEIDSLLPKKYRTKKTIDERIEENTQWWKDRQANAQSALTKKNVKQTQAQLRKYYEKAMNECTNQFELTYLKLLNTQDDIKATPADLYKLDKYWEMQGQISRILTRLGDKQSAFLRKIFINHYAEVYYSIDIDGNYSSGFKNIDKKAIEQLINQIWCADGETWSKRVWTNTENLKQALNEGLVNCVGVGSSPEELKRELVFRFNVSYAQANTLVKTEMVHIQTQAAVDRYKDAGIEEFQVWADEDERRCEICGKLHKKKYLMGETPPIPAHPNCRCTIIPVVD